MRLAIPLHAEPGLTFEQSHPSKKSEGYVPYFTPPRSASSSHFQWQSTSTKPISRSQLICVSTSNSRLDGSSSFGARPRALRNRSCRRAVGEETYSRLQKTP